MPPPNGAGKRARLERAPMGPSIGNTGQTSTGTIIASRSQIRIRTVRVFATLKAGRAPSLIRRSIDLTDMYM